jgi:ferritin-like protein
MTDSLMKNAETRLASDADGSYKARLIELLEDYENEFAQSKQGFLPPDAYDVVEHLEVAVKAAISIVKAYEPDEGDSSDSSEAELFTP